MNRMILARSEDSSKTSSDSSINAGTYSLLIALVILLSVALVLVGALVLLRKLRKAQKAKELPTYENSTRERPPTIIIPFSEKQSLVGGAQPSPTSPVPEIRITFPEEEDRSGRRVSGTVVLVQSGNSVAYRPVQDGLPPSYSQSNGNSTFQNVDLDTVGGLREKF